MLAATRNSPIDWLRKARHAPLESRARAPQRNNESGRRDPRGAIGPVPPRYGNMPAGQPQSRVAAILSRSASARRPVLE